MTFEPKILGILCNWCSYAGADLAGVSRVQYPPNIRVIRVMCSGRVDPMFIFRALQVGADGVIVMGCHIGDCHYLEGNYEALNKFGMTKKFLELIGLDNRVHLEWVSASEGVRYGSVVTEFTDRIRKLGPSPAKSDETLMKKLNAIDVAAATERMRSLVGRQRKITEQENVYGDKVPIEEFDAIFNKAILDEYNRAQIYLALEEKNKNVKELAKELDIDPNIVLEHLLILKYRMQVDFGELIGNTPEFLRM